jgi:hypothetical protein
VLFTAYKLHAIGMELIAMDTSARVVLYLAKPTMGRLEQLHTQKGVSKGEILRQALSVYSYILEQKDKDHSLRVLLERSNGKQTELVLPTDIEAAKAPELVPAGA